MENEMEEEFLTFDDALQMLGTSRPTLYRLLSSGDVKGLKVGKQWRFRRADLQAYMERGPVAIAAAPEQDVDAELAALRAESDDFEGLSGLEKTVQLAQLIIHRAIDRRSSDIHIETGLFDGDLYLWIRYRIDGVLVEVRRMPMSLQEALLAQLKSMADMNVAEKRLPQDGRILMRYNDKDFDLRTAATPAVYGESFVVRILDRANILVALNDLRSQADVFDRLNKLIRQPNGMVVFTGPTGSGKTVTAYACLTELAGPQIKTMTVEDPVECTFPYVTQCGVNQRSGLSFPNILRSLMRQDPDVIYVGECRDLQTVQMAVEASLSGHMVLTCLHTNDAPSAITRLADIGIEPYLIAASLTGVVAQRLCRKICEDCKETYTATAGDLAKFGWEVDDPKRQVKLYRGTGCDKCRNRGYRGRTALFEVMPVTEEIADMIVSRVPISEIRKAAREAGMKDLREDGFAKVLAGVTTPDEVMRVVYTGGL